MTDLEALKEARFALHLLATKKGNQEKADYWGEARDRVKALHDKLSAQEALQTDYDEFLKNHDPQPTPSPEKAGPSDPMCKELIRAHLNFTLKVFDTFPLNEAEVVFRLNALLKDV